MIYILINDISKIGGTSRVALNLYEALKEKGYEIKIVTGNIDKNSFDFYKSSNEDLINLNIGSPHKLKNRVELLIWYINYFLKARKIVKKSDIIISIETFINFIGSFTKAKKKIATEHRSFKRRAITTFLKRFFYKKVDFLVVLTERDKNLYKNFISNVIVIENFIKIPKNFSTLKNKNILFVGHLTKIKGVDFLEKIVRKFDKKDWKFIVVGDGKKFQAENIEFKGELRDVSKEYLNSSIFIMTSRSEAFPMVLLEAKSYALPIVAFDCETGPREIIKDREDGFLVPVGDIEKFLEKLKLLTNDDNLRKNMGQKARENAKKYSKKRIIKQWINLIES